MTNHITSLLKTKLKIFNINFALQKTGAIQGTSREHLYHKLGLESLAN